MKNKTSFTGRIAAVLALSSLTLSTMIAPALAAPDTTTSLTPKRLAAYTPFPNARAMPLKACTKAVMTGKDMRAQASMKCSRASINWRFDQYQIGIELRSTEMRSAGRSRSISFNDGGGDEGYADFREPRAFEGDLNGDGRTDYLIQHGQGQDWAAVTDVGSMVLALSGPSGHKFVRSFTTLLTPNSLIRQGGKVYLLKASLLFATGTDGKTHSYYRFVPLEVRGQRLITNKGIWIQYTKAANHTPARNVSAAEKTSTLRDYGLAR